MCLGLAAAPQTSGPSSQLTEAGRLQQAVDKVRNAMGIPGMVVGVAGPGHDPIIVASGESDRSKHVAVQTDDLFGIGSVTKMFVAVVVLQLAEEGKLGLDDTIAQYLPDFPHGQHITVRMLLQHRSGLGDFASQLSYNPGDATAGLLLFVAVQHQWTHDELVQLAVAQPPMFPPGEGCRYSNADYILLGRIIELCTGRTVAEEIRTRILTPLGLKHTFLAGEERLPPSRMRCYRLFGADYVDCLASENASLAWSAGAMASDASDLLRFAPALFEGKLLKPEMLAQMVSFEPIDLVERYGMGVREHNAGFGLLWGHQGQTIGFTCVLWYDPATHDTYVVLTNMQLEDQDPLVQAARACLHGTG